MMQLLAFDESKAAAKSEADNDDDKSNKKVE